MRPPHFKHWKKAAAELLFPRRLCAFCGAESPQDILCPDCRRAKENLRSCPSCATFLLPTKPKDQPCSSCRSLQRPFRRARAALPYEGLLRQRLLDFKYEGDSSQQAYLLPLLQETFSRSFAELQLDLLLPVPLSAQRYLERGYNHAEMLSSLLAAEIGLPHRPELLIRSRNTAHLAKLSPQQRFRELRGAFFAEPGCAGRSILLVDDIFTSGATASACTQALLKAGAKAVYVLTVAAGWDPGDGQS
ncbi:MAG: ComF family protein [Bacillota bacterium]|nr:ComF family protein [Bacillota bacterium]